MITKKQWKELCDKIRLKRNEGKDIYYGIHQHRIQACFSYGEIVILTDAAETKLSYTSFPNQSYHQVSSQFYWIEIHNLSDIK